MIQQYIGSASITNQFSNQIKKRITMLNKSYKMGSAWKIAMLLPALAVALVAISCTDKESVYAIDEPAKEAESFSLEDEPLNFTVETMPTFQGEGPKSFRKYIAQNLRYPEAAKEAGVTGKVFVKFVVTRTGKVMIPKEEYVAKHEGKNLDEVVVVAYRTLEKDAEAPDEKYIQLFKEEVIRVVSESPDWEPGIQKGEAVNVMFTFPVVFAMQ
jgi:protein TonB